MEIYLNILFLIRCSFHNYVFTYNDGTNYLPCYYKTVTVQLPLLSMDLIHGCWNYIFKVWLGEQGPKKSKKRLIYLIHFSYTTPFLPI